MSHVQPTVVSDGDPRAAVDHAYPVDLVRMVQERWAEEIRRDPTHPRHMSALLPRRLLGRVISTCYQASLLREEGRPVAFRLVVGSPDWFRAGANPPTGLYRLIFEVPRPFDAQELRRVVPAAAFHRALIGVRAGGDGLKIWGMIDSGPRWLQSARGGRDIDQSVPPVLTVAVTGPGRLAVSRGAVTLAELLAGSLRHAAVDVFNAPWLTTSFPRLEGLGDTPASDVLSQLLSLHVLRRIVATIREARHGGTLFFIPRARLGVMEGTSAALRLKYRFVDEEPRRRLQTLISRITRQLGARHRSADGAGWHDYETTTNAALHSLDEALFEIAHFIAGFADVDGAVVLTTDLEILGFGGEVSGSLPEVDRVARSVDIDGASVRYERTDAVGMRHRSAYRFCEHAQGTIAIVLSQDGGVRFVRWTKRGVTFWDQLATSPWET